MFDRLVGGKAERDLSNLIGSSTRRRMVSPLRPGAPKDARRKLDRTNLPLLPTTLLGAHAL
jgi:hypothetical protein